MSSKQSHDYSGSDDEDLIPVAHPKTAASAGDKRPATKPSGDKGAAKSSKKKKKAPPAVEEVPPASDDSDDDIFGDGDGVVTKNVIGARPAMTATKKIDEVDLNEGQLLAYPLNTKNTVTGTILGASVKGKEEDPKTIKASVLITNIEKPGKDIVRTDGGLITAFVKTVDANVKAPNGTTPHAKLIYTDVAPTFKPTGGVVQVTLPLKGDAGTKQTMAKELVPGAAIVMNGLRYSNEGVASTYMNCSAGDYKVKEKVPSDAPREGVKIAIDTMRKTPGSSSSGHRRLLILSLHCAYARLACPRRRLVA